MSQTRLRSSVLATFRSSLAALSTTLESTAAHYVRCIKPNAAQAANDFDGECATYMRSRQKKRSFGQTPPWVFG